MRPGWECIEVCEFTLPSLPPSKNKLHSVIRLPGMPLQFKRSKEYELWRMKVMTYIPKLTTLGASQYFAIHAQFEYPFHHDNGKHRRLDAHNFMEALCDVIAEKNGFDDSYVKFTSAEAYDSSEEVVRVRVEQVGLAS